NIFFFSSRRRHTRSKRDWSSDVCSSDLKNQFERFASRIEGFSARPSMSFLIFSMSSSYDSISNKAKQCLLLSHSFLHPSSYKLLNLSNSEIKILHILNIIKL